MGGGSEIRHLQGRIHLVQALLQSGVLLAKLHQTLVHPLSQWCTVKMRRNRGEEVAIKQRVEA